MCLIDLMGSFKYVNVWSLFGYGIFFFFFCAAVRSMIMGFFFRWRGFVSKFFFSLLAFHESKMSNQQLYGHVEAINLSKGKPAK